LHHTKPWSNAGPSLIGGKLLVVVFKRGHVRFVFLLTDVADMMLGEKDLPVGSRFAVNLPALREGIYLRLATTVGINASVHRIGQHEIDHMVARLLPADDSSHSSHQSLRGQFETLPCQVRENPADRAELPEEAKDEFDGVSHTLICLQPDLTTENIILQTDRHIPDQSTALG
jgi:hypothetical protein